MNGWIRPLRRDLWRIPLWRKLHKMMSAQAIAAGGILVTGLMYAEVDHFWVMATVYMTLAAAAYGSLVEQPELEENDK